MSTQLEAFPTYLPPWSSLTKKASNEVTKRNVPNIIELLARGKNRLSEGTSESVVAACGVIEFCVKLHNDPSVGGAQPKMDGKLVKQIQRQLSELMEKVINQAEDYYIMELLDCETSSKEAKAIALATTALFKLETHGADCKREMNKSGGIQAAVMGFQKKSGVNLEAKEALVEMLHSYVTQNFGNVHHTRCITHNGGIELLLAYSQSEKTPEKAQEFCCSVMEACMKHDKTITDSDQIVRLISKTSVRKSKSNQV